MVAKFISLLLGLLKPLVVLITYLQGKKAGRAEAELKQVIEDAQLQSEYAEIGSRPRDTSDTVKSMRNGSF